MTNEEKKSAYEIMLAQAKALFANEDNALANFSNASALLNTTLPNSVFTGFYLMDNVKNGPPSDVRSFWKTARLS